MKKLLILLSVCCLAQTLSATPAQVLLLRHGEKEETGDNLSKKGYERAAALAPFLTHVPLLTSLTTPVAIYAQQASKNYPSKRPVQTVTPLALALKLPILDHYTKERYEKMCAEILQKPEYTNKLVIICWSHDNLTPIAKCLGVKQLSDWPGKQFDRVGLITYAADGTATFQDLPQKLLFGDTAS